MISNMHFDHLKPKPFTFEPVSNPLLIVANGNEIIRLAKERGIKVVVDNTLQLRYCGNLWNRAQRSMFCQRDQHLAGHGNITVGVVCGHSDELHKAALTHCKFVGTFFTAWMTLYRLGTQLQTF